MNSKKFKLPKEFAEKWIEALKSEKYQQGYSSLASVEENWDDDNGVPSVSDCKFCCLGIAAMISENSLLDLLEVEYLYIKKKYTGIPKELVTIESGEDNLLVQILSLLNDGLSDSNYVQDIKNEGYNFKTDLDLHFTKHSEIQFGFNQIVEFIEDNVELY